MKETNRDGKSDISPLFPLIEHERALRELWLSHPDIIRPEEFLGNHAFREIFSLLVPDIGEDEFDELKESFYFQDREDVTVHRHDRYTPPFLHTHEFIEVIYVINGTCLHRVSEETFRMSAGDLCILAPSAKHGISAFSDEDIIFNILLRKSTFEEAFFDLLSDENIISDFFSRMLYHSQSRPYLYFQTEDDREIRELSLRILEETQADRKYKNRLLSLKIREFFVLLLRNHETDVVSPKADAADKTSVAILHYIQTHYQTVTLSELSGLFHYSERQIQRIVADATGRSFKENIQTLKVQEAKRILRNPGLTIADAAERLGYSDTASFRRAFKKYAGVLPGEYRRRQQQNSEQKGIQSPEIKF